MSSATCSAPASTPTISPRRCACSPSCTRSTTSTRTSSPCATRPPRCSRPSSACAARRSATRSPRPTRPSSPAPPPAPPTASTTRPAGHDLATSVVDAPIAGELLKPRNCYICKQPYTQVDAFYHQLCPDCARFSHGKRNARTDLTGKRALLTGGRAKIGMHIALRLLRDGAHTTITTRFPRDAVRRFSALPDSADWLHRLRVVGIDLRDPAQVIALADSVAAQGPLDILINNAAQTVRRSPGAYSLLADAELQPLPDGPLPEMETFGHTADPHPQALQASVDAHPLLSVAALGGTVAEQGGQALTAEDLARLAMAPGSSSLEKHADGTAIDAGGLVPDVNRVNSWVQSIDQVDPLEMLEVQLANTTAPFLLISRLRASMAASDARTASTS